MGHRWGSQEDRREWMNAAYRAFRATRDPGPQKRHGQ
jgi:hypothetical protein